jgi:hypothetical protein
LQLPSAFYYKADMPKMLGSIPADRWERQVYLQLKQQLPDDWVVITNVAWARRGPTDDWRYVRDGEADVVVIVPQMGMVILEIKGSRSFRVGPDGRWYRVDERTRVEVAMDEPPPAQAARNMFELRDAVMRKTGWQDFPGLYAFVVVYPQGALVSAPPLYDTSTLVLASQILDLKSRIRSALANRGSGERGERLVGTTMEHVVSILAGLSVQIVKADTPLDVREDLDRIEVLTRQQFAALQGIFAHPRVAVVGPAGSGKTVLALWRLAALAEAGQRAIYVCFNKALAESLQRSDPRLAQSITNVDRYFYQLAVETKTLPPQSEIRSDRSEFFRERLPGIVMDLAAGWKSEDRFDSIIVDEGQDFSELQLIALLELLKPEVGTYVFFADWRQDVFRASMAGAIGADVLFSLHHNCRNTARINTLTNRLMSSRVPSMPGVPEGVNPIIELRSDAASMASRAWQLAREWQAPGARVAILSPYTMDRSCMAVARIGKGARLVTRLEDWEAGSVYYSTIKAFKGIEAASVIVVDVEKPGWHVAFDEEDLYVACTRATTRLALLSQSKDAVEWMMSPRSGRQAT